MTGRKCCRAAGQAHFASRSSCDTSLGSHEDRFLCGVLDDLQSPAKRVHVSLQAVVGTCFAGSVQKLCKAAHAGPTQPPPSTSGARKSMVPHFPTSCWSASLSFSPSPSLPLLLPCCHMLPCKLVGAPAGADMLSRNHKDALLLREPACIPHQWNAKAALWLQCPAPESSTLSGLISRWQISLVCLVSKSHTPAHHAPTKWRHGGRPMRV